MTIIDYMRQKLTEYPKISEFLAGDDIHIDFTEPDPVNYGLSSNGDRTCLAIRSGGTISPCMLQGSLLRIITGWQTAISFWNWPIG